MSILPFTSWIVAVTGNNPMLLLFLGAVLLMAGFLVLTYDYVKEQVLSLIRRVKNAP